MRYLLIPQLSSRTACCQGLDYFKDSNYNFNHQLKKSLEYNDQEAILILPDGTNDFKFVTDPFYSRFTFDFDGAINLIEKYNPDVVLENDPAKVMCWNMIRFNLKKQFKIFTYNHWLDTKWDRKIDNDYCTYMYRQFEGHKYADKSGFNSNFAIGLFMRNASHLFKDDFEAINRKLFKLPPLIDIDEFIPYEDNKKENIIVFSHRISALPYYWKNLTNTLDLIKRSDLLKSMTLMITNPSNKDHKSVIEELEARELENYEFANLSRTQYLDMISRARMGFCLFESPGMWSISAVELSYFCPVIGLNHSGYSELLNFKFDSMNTINIEYVEEIFKNPEINESYKGFFKTIDVKTNDYIRNFLIEKKVSNVHLSEMW